MPNTAGINPSDQETRSPDHDGSETLQYPQHTEASPSSEFCSALAKLREVREHFQLSETLLDASSWAQHSLFEPLVAALQKMKDTIINRNVLVPVTAFMTFVFNPVLFSELRTSGGPTIAQFAAASNYLSESLAGRMFLNVVQSVCNNPLVIESNSLISPDNDPITNAFLLSGGLAQIFALGYPVVRTVEYIFASANRRERARQGLEPLPSVSKPSLVVVADSAFADIVLENIPKRRANWRKPTVIAHPDDKVPRAYELRDTEFHVRIPASEERPFVSEVMRRTGMDRARQIVVGAFNHTKAIFYGNEGGAAISPSFCTTLLGHLASQQKNETEHVILILPKHSTLLGTKPFSHLLHKDQQLMATVNKQRIQVDVVHPEDIIMEMLEKQVSPLLAARKEDTSSSKRPFNICLIGDDNHTALKNFSKEIEARFPQVKVTIIANEVIGTISHAEFNSLTPEQRLAKQEAVLTASDLNLVYSEVDATTTDLAGLFADDSTRDRTQEKRQTIVIMETPDGAQEARNLNYRCICLYDGIMDKVSALLADTSLASSVRRKTSVGYGVTSPTVPLLVSTSRRTAA